MSAASLSATESADTSRTGSSYDSVTCPRHYAGDGKVECKQALVSMMAGYDASDAVPRSTAYWCGCAFKYLWRWPLKNDVEDLKKVQECIRLAVESVG